MTHKFKIGDKVEKISGYTFRGTVVSVYEKLNGDPRVDVEVSKEDYHGCTCVNCEDPNGAGMIHIFNPDQLTLI